ncbi:unnamed protein product [Medioppia subpectinata]|uniref:Uncharacterized protein n=1 Tax=Medioppia subpectinata TaxID=1979941 RepID=A0A7R9KLU4_9ACAR|nr:unnamed protein product [Medioppia subpectinata]CAG2105862.1 unnamed protein product [Medioppia subpectinata]
MYVVFVVISSKLGVKKQTIISALESEELDIGFHQTIGDHSLAIAPQIGAINLITILVIISFLASHALLIQWYRLGDLDPKFRYLLLWNSVNICVLCIVAIVYYHYN